ncbi:esterase OVCA2 [Ictalurus punctatus]|uniref:Esterase OVCA2 n=1 Tax=Ictalurus punctatus TaxID=7998 RepID=W5U7R0_ICTPU|nr:esterase OVCA2 [Ictalurus punctatus]XP_017345039.1 esterase OVCA2 [Ictalurus punctatus]
MSKADVPLRILCIHGYRQSSTSFREKTGALRKLFKKQVEFVYIDAPHKVPTSNDSEVQEKPASVDENQRAWWFSDVQARSFDSRQECESSLGLEQSLEAVRIAVMDLGTFDGILGFSQGAALVAMLCSLQEQKLDPTFNFRFAILIAGFRSACAQHEYFYKGVSIMVPSLHVFGQDDKVISEQMSRDLLPLFLGARILTHQGGHFVPASSTHKHIYQEFLKRFQ